ncbi:hypothetical protein [Streptomyces sp. CC208A]|uniref:hypothetical protein n=1 Tax=Streptomyces sp. CC208A TaxID=3044573 RepID=UPI0024A80F5B|nr:hypothetical protein [Streptomyces sp. CC208A]
MSNTTTRPTTADLITPELCARLVADVRKIWPELTDDMGRRGVDQMVSFLVTAAHSTEPLSPSLRVDLFWHAFITRTVPYIAFCKALGLEYIHHVPEDDETGTDPEAGRTALAATKDAIIAAGYGIDPEFWPGEGVADCTQCHAGCHNSPKK